MFAQLPMYQREGKAAYKANLDNTLKLDEHFGSPHKQFKTIHVGGTNGKGSVSHMLASILQEAGYKTGLYTSPHLKDFRERIKINGEMITEQYVINFVEENKSLFAGIKPSFFEMTVAMAFQYFADQQVDIAVIEVGLGGRLDSTNIITPLASVITNISFDHMALLGDTLEKIAHEKAGIIKPGVPAIIGTKDPASDFVFIEKAKECETTLEFASENWQVTRDNENAYRLENKNGIVFVPVQADLKGLYQRKNIPAVLETVLSLRNNGLHISDQNIYNGIANTIRNTGLLGRWQELSQTPYTVCDTGHNVGGISYIVEQLKHQKYDRLHIVMGMVNDKDISGVLSMMPKDAIYYFTRADVKRALPENELQALAQQVGLQGQSYPNVKAAVEAAKQHSSEKDFIFVGGSSFIVADLLKFHV